MKLSICVVTMNRAGQLKEALESCLACVLPEQTEFVIIDNASTDETEQTVHSVLKDCGYAYYYEKLPKNLGVGGGRNYAFAKSCGKYVYVLDDDAVIDTKKNPDFFAKAIEILDANRDIVSLTTQIYDEVWKADRVKESGPVIVDGVYLCKMFCGGSHFLRKSFFVDVPYLPNRYGYEEIPPSLRIMDAGKYNVVCPELMVRHKPVVDKWDYSKEDNHDLLVNGIASPYALMKMMYPKIYQPLLWAAAQMRIYHYLKGVPHARRRFRAEVKEICTTYRISDKVKVSTVWRMIKNFGFSAF